LKRKEEGWAVFEEEEANTQGAFMAEHSTKITEKINGKDSREGTKSGTHKANNEGCQSEKYVIMKRLNVIRLSLSIGSNLGNGQLRLTNLRIDDHG
jgi:hypothetical protein